MHSCVSMMFAWSRFVVAGMCGIISLVSVHERGDTDFRSLLCIGIIEDDDRRCLHGSRHLLRAGELFPVRS